MYTFQEIFYITDKRKRTLKEHPIEHLVSKKDTSIIIDVDNLGVVGTYNHKLKFYSLLEGLHPFVLCHVVVWYRDMMGQDGFVLPLMKHGFLERYTFDSLKGREQYYLDNLKDIIECSIDRIIDQ